MVGTRRTLLRQLAFAGCFAAGIAAWPSALAFEQAELEALLDEARVAMDMPGLRAAVRFADGRIERAAVGLADLEAGTALGDTVGMPGGSTGKTFVAALIMLMVEDGTLALDDPVARWLADEPWFGRLPNADEMRVRHLLSHTSGIADYPDSWRFQVASLWRALRRGSVRFETEELIGFALDGRAPFAAGEGFRYTDVGYLVLGHLIEAATGRAYYELLQERILDPQELDGIRVADRSILPDVTPGYSRGARNLRKDGTMKFDPTSEWTGGGLITNPTMLVRFFAALADGRVVQPGSFEQMLHGGWRNGAHPERWYGLGMFVYDGGKAFGHGGLWPGYRTHVVHYLATDITVAAQSNRDGVDMEGVVGRIARACGAR